MTHPHAGGETFAANVAEREHCAFVCLLDGEEVTRQMPHRKDLAGDVERSIMHQARRTQTTVHLRGFEDGGVQFRVLMLKRFELEFEGRQLRGKCCYSHNV